MNSEIVTNCGSNPTGFTISSTPAMMAITESWVSTFAVSCPQTTVQVENVTSSSLSAQRLCDLEDTVDVAGMSRDFLESEARLLPLRADAVPRAGYRYKFYCNDGRSIFVDEDVRQVEVAIEALVVITNNDLQDDVMSCIDLIGGLSIPQLRWIYSSYTDQELNSLNDGWNETEVIPNSDGNSSTRLWSELNPQCASEEIVVSGPTPDSLDFDLFSQLVLSDMENGEMIDTTRNGTLFQPSNDAVLSLVNTTAFSLGFIGFQYYLDHSHETSTVPILAVEEEYRGQFLRPWPPFRAVMVSPSVEVLQNGTSYALSRRLYMNVRLSALANVNSFMVLVFSGSGQEMLAEHGLVPLSTQDRFIMLSRLGADGGIPDAAAIRCPGLVARRDRTYAVSEGLVPLTTLFVEVYRDTCLARTTIVRDTTAGAANRVCRGDDDDSATAVLAMMPREFGADEAAQLRSGFAFRCIAQNNQGDRRTIHEFVVALDAIVFGTAAQGAARDCVSLLGGLGIDQLRWIYSSLTFTELVTEGWNPMAVPNSDGNDSTRLWSELDSRCAALEINRTFLVGEGTEVLDFFSTVALTAEGESVDVRTIRRSTTSISNDGIALLSLSVFEREHPLLILGGVQDGSGAYVVPSERTIQDRSYGSLVRPIFMNARIGGGAFNWFTLRGILDLLLSPDGGLIAAYEGYVPLSDEDMAEMRRRQDDVVSRVYCFSSNTKLEVQGKGRIPISDIKIGDLVRSVKGTYERVYSFGHHGSTELADFLQIHVEEGVAVEVTGDHLMAVNGVVSRANSIKRGDLLTRAIGGTAKVTKVKMVTMQGVFAPFTESGMISVNGYVASCYAHVGGRRWNSFFLGSVDSMTYQFLAHLAQAPHRLLCDMDFKLCENEVYNEAGISWWSSQQLGVFDWLDEQRSPMALLLALPLVFVLMMFRMVEVFGKNPFLTIGSIVVALSMATASYKRKTR